MTYRTSIEVTATDDTLRSVANAHAAHSYPEGNFRFLAVRPNFDDEIPATHIIDIEVTV